MSNILITGDLGFIGSYLAKQMPHIGLDKKRGQHEDILTCDLPDDIDIVIHLAALSDVIESIADPVETIRQNIEGTVRLAKYYPKAKFIFASTGGAIQKKIESPYGLSKFCAEEFVKLIHDNYVGLRFANVYGPGSRSVVDKFLDQSKIEIYGDGTAIRSYVHVEDIVRGICQAFDWPTGIYKLGNYRTHSVLQLARVVHKPTKFVDWVPGELRESEVENTTPNWKPTIDVLDYMKERIS